VPRTSSVVPRSLSGAVEGSFRRNSFLVQLLYVLDRSAMLLAVRRLVWPAMAA
jgi:hypothetical protein